ncbi:3720_t:CDS:2, partial [Ambispora gerdemannii]
LSAPGIGALPRKWMDALPRRLMHYHKGGYTTTEIYYPERNNEIKSKAKQRLQFYFKKEVKIQRRNSEERKAKETTRKTSLSTECK